MRFSNYLAAKTQAAQPPQHVDYPKYIDIEGRRLLVLNAEEEAEALATLEDPEQSEEEESSPPPTAENLLSAPAKKPRGRPVGWRKPVLVTNETKD